MNEQWVDYYEILELEFGCSDEDIKNNYRILMKKYHPDSIEANEEKAIEINEAYEILGDPEKRASYDSTYFQYKNGEFDESQEMPKYTYEEMKATFTEEEIRFAKKVALQQNISETLESAKIIIDAKNELLLAAFNDDFDDDMYRSEYKEFYSNTNSFINNLQDLMVMAREYGLASEVDTIQQVIDYLIEVMDDIPASLVDAKFKVKLELIREQLGGEAKITQEEAMNNIQEFISLYLRVYREHVSQDEFKTSYNILKLKAENSLSKLGQIYDLLKKAELDADFKDVGVLIGKIKSILELYSSKYSVAQKIGKREDLKERINSNLLSFSEYKEKMLEIMRDIIADPTMDNAKLKVVEGRTLTDNFRANFKTIDKNENADMEYKDLMKNIYKDVKAVYSKRNKLRDKLTKIFDSAEKQKVSSQEIEMLTEDIETSQEEIEAIKLLKRISILMGECREYESICNDDLKKQIRNANKCLEKSTRLLSNLESMLEYIELLTNEHDLNFDKKTDNSMDYEKINELKAKSESYQELATLLGILEKILIFGSLLGAFILGNPEATQEFKIGTEILSIRDTTIYAIMFSIVVRVTSLVATSELDIKAREMIQDAAKYSSILDDSKLFDMLQSGNDYSLQDFYEKSLKI